ncbi:glycosyltransferase family 4 protein [Psychrosphaera aestuarii]|uniref:glycosyltransferase family 4 protein n=1 Tax=Psychrosphaera aestuarii TaxID=1266052 RepID=UPI001B31A0E0|nr:glycosyltransferase family 4 protein [Psychrosphaera aestuarii]
MVGFFINYTRTGGAEQYFYALAQSFKQKGIEAELYSGGGQGSPEEVKVNKFNNMYLDTDRFSALSLMKKVYFLCIPIVCLFVGLKYFNSLRKLRVVICSHPFPTILALCLSKVFRFKVIKVVHHILPNEYSCLEGHFGKADHYISVSNEVRDHLLNHNIRSEVIYNPINLDIEINSVERSKIIMLSHVHKDKKESIEAFCNLASNYPNLLFEVIGESTSEFAQDAILSYPNIKFHGAMPRKHALSYVNKNAKVFVGVGRSAVEAAMMQIPTIIAGHVKGKKGGNFSGVLTLSNIDAVSYNNYSGRNSSSHTSSELEPCFNLLISNQINELDLPRICLQLIEKHDVNNIRKQFERYVF